MALPPAKRKRMVILNSDDDEGVSVTSKTNLTQQDTTAKSFLPSRPRKKVSNAKPSKESPTSPQPLSEKPTKKPKGGTSSRSISTFFSAHGQGQKQASHKQASHAKPTVEAADVVGKEEEEGLIEDVSDVDSDGKGWRTQDTARSVLDRRKRIVESDGDAMNGAKQGILLRCSQNFKLPGNEMENGRKGVKGNDLDQRPWADRFAPLNLDELAVHKKKVSGVRSWLENVRSGKDRRRLLILKGPAGAGKTATLRILAQSMSLHISEWRNPVGTEYSSIGYVSMAAHFEDFLGRSGNFDRLEFEGMPIEAHTAATSKTQPQDGYDKQKIILLEEFPDTFLGTSTALQSFRSSILQFLAASTPSLGAFSHNSGSSHPSVTPIVMIVTETRLTSTTTPRDTFTVHRLLGSDILSNPAVDVIEFNAVATTFTRKALDLVIQKEARHSGRRRVPGPSVLQRLCEVGDVRSAIGSLEFLCVRAQDGDDWGGRVAVSAKRGANANTSLTKMERNSLEIVTQRETSLGLFHAVGKVVYNKRDDSSVTGSTNEIPVQPPDHLWESRRLKVAKTSIDKLLDETGTDVETFISALHENYVMSCEGQGFIDTLNGCLGGLSDGDLLGTSRGGRNGGTEVSMSYGSPSESLRQDEIAFQVVVRGLLFALPDPVKRSSHPAGVHGRRSGKADSHKMFYPVSMRLLRQIEEMEHSIDKWHKRLKILTAGEGRSVSEAGNIFKPHKPRQQQQSAMMDALTNPEPEESESFRTNLNCTKAELILERLPYITKIERAKTSSTHLRELENLTQFHGIDVPNDDTEEGEDEDDVDSASLVASTGIVATTSTSVSKMQESRNEIAKEAFKAVISVEEEVERLYLIDDDIED